VTAQGSGVEAEGPEGEAAYGFDFVRDDSKSVAAVEFDVARLEGLEVAGEAFARRAFDHCVEQGAAEAAALMLGFNAEKREIPVTAGHLVRVDLLQPRDA
jgi:hypothetical protein